MSAGQKRAPGVGAQGAADEKSELYGSKVSCVGSEVKRSCNATSDTPELRRYFGGEPTNLGYVAVLPVSSFAELVTDVLAVCVPVGLSQAELLALPERQQNEAKRTRYIVPCAFKSSPSPRQTGHATVAHLLCLDVDDAAEGRRFLAVGPEKLLGDLNAVVWHTARSTSESPRLRIIVPTEPVPVAIYGRAVTALAAVLGMNTVNHESKVPVQPMYLPLAFKGATESPVIYTKTDGRDFQWRGISSVAAVGECDGADNGGDGAAGLEDLIHL
jgi:hypothetical protein